jgi:predicted small secreted protein
MLKRLLFIWVAITALVVGVTGCHTAHGAGQDVSSVGNAVQEHTPP